MIYRPSPPSGPLLQGEIVANLVQARLDIESVALDSSPTVSFETHRYAIVLTQGCDLESDYMRRTRQRETGSYIPAILFCELSEADIFKSGADMKSNIWQRVQKNKDERYHYLRAVGADVDAAGEGTPDLALDFKRFFTVPTEEVYRRFEIGELKRRACLESPYREHLATRFFYYQLRVALPDEHFVKPAVG